jgi:methionyl-tRNA formyltransferase
MLMEEGLDTGPVVGVSHIGISNIETTGSLHDQLALLTASCLCDIIDAAPASLESPVSQSEDGVIYAAKITSEDAMIDWTRSAAILDYHIRALSPYPGAWCNGPKGRLRILQARPISLTETTPNIPPNSITGKFLCRHDDGAMVIGCGDHALAIARLQPAGKSAMAASDFLNGAGLVVGDLLDLTNR